MRLQAPNSCCACRLLHSIHKHQQHPKILTSMHHGPAPQDISLCTQQVKCALVEHLIHKYTNYPLQTAPSYIILSIIHLPVTCDDTRHRALKQLQPTPNSSHWVVAQPTHTALPAAAPHKGRRLLDRIHTKPWHPVDSLPSRHTQRSAHSAALQCCISKTSSTNVATTSYDSTAPLANKWENELDSQ